LENNTYIDVPNNLASFLAFLSRSHPDLYEVIQAWTDLPEAVQRGILATVRSTQ
jgi:predicted ATPase